MIYKVKKGWGLILALLLSLIVTTKIRINVIIIMDVFKRK